MVNTIKKYFSGSIIFTLLAMVLGGVYGYYTGGVQTASTYVFIMAVLGVLETSLSFDNAVVNAKVLETMDNVWRHRFLTWGMVIAVFGMRIVFPILLVSIIAHVGVVDAVTMALSKPEEYAKTLTSSHILIAGFGGSFLLLVGLSYFFDYEKETHWIKGIEKLISHAGGVKSSEIIATLVIVLTVTFTLVPEHERFSFLIASILGVVIHELVVGVSEFLENYEAKQLANGVIKGGVMSFIYLEIVDASFSFDGVIGAFVISNNFIIIALGLGIGAMFVRSLTILLVDKGTMTEYVYLEHGAFWSIIILSGIMFASISYEIPEIVTGILSIGFIASAYISSVVHNKKEGCEA